MTRESETKHITIGTAGHVDHGKTTLIRALTGINTDRLKEEQERGLTIDLGFASLRLPSGKLVGIVDVPGHERFLKNMLAGASGVDVALLVVAADEGVMPQTREHLDILELLETGHGVVALTKCDMVEDDWLDIVEEDLRNYLKHTFLGGAHIIRVSGVTGQGIGELVAQIDRLVELAEQRSIAGPFRIPVDRVFTMTGFGTVVTGTLVSGTLRIGDPVRVMPENIDTRVRQLQVHGIKQEEVYAGTRVAVNLAGVEVPDLKRGSVLLPPGYLQASTALDASVQVLEGESKPIKNRQRVRLHIGTAEVIGRTLILQAEEIPPGGRGLVRLKLEKPVVAARSDRFVLRSYSPMNVIGGGVVLDPVGARHRRRDAGLIDRLERALKGDPADIVEDALKASETGMFPKDVATTTGLAEPQVSALLRTLIDEGRAVQSSGRFIQKAAFELAASRIVSEAALYHKTYPMRPGISREELRGRLGHKIESKGFGAILSLMSEAGEVIVTESTVKLPGHQPALSEAQARLADRISAEFKAAGCNPPLVSEVLERSGGDSREIIAMLTERGDLIRISDDLCMHREAVESAERLLREYLARNQQITVREFRDLIDSSRK